MIMDSKVAPNATCHFLRVPLEIRHEIYSYLLLDPPEASLDPTYNERVFNEMMEEVREFKTMDGANDVLEHSSNDPDTDTEGEGTVMYNHLIVHQPDPLLEAQPLTPPDINEEEFQKRFLAQVAAEEKRKVDWKRKFEHEHKIYRYPVILQTNRQIYNEASTFLYSSLVMEVRPGDVILSDVWKDIVEPTDKIWRSCPIHLAAKSPVKELNCRGANLGGTMEPHVFAKFEKIAFSVDLNFDARKPEAFTVGERLWPMLSVDENFRTSRGEEEGFTACLNGDGTDRPPVSDIFQHFVNMLVKSPYISHLAVILGVDSEAAFEFNLEDDDAREEEMIAEHRKRKMNIANKRVVELILEAGVLNPLKQLDNVKRFSLSFDELPYDGAEFEPKHKHLDIIKDLREKVEGNFLAKCGPM